MIRVRKRNAPSDVLIEHVFPASLTRQDQPFQFEQCQELLANEGSRYSFAPLQGEHRLEHDEIRDAYPQLFVLDLLDDTRGSRRMIGVVLEEVAE